MSALRAPGHWADEVNNRDRWVDRLKRSAPALHAVTSSPMQKESSTSVDQSVVYFSISGLSASCAGHSAPIPPRLEVIDSAVGAARKLESVDSLVVFE